MDGDRHGCGRNAGQALTTGLRRAYRGSDSWTCRGRRKPTMLEAAGIEDASTAKHPPVGRARHSA
eukprot:6312929-Pyramimonas_sp.AAC.1